MFHRVLPMKWTCKYTRWNLSKHQERTGNTNAEMKPGPGGVWNCLKTMDLSSVKYQWIVGRLIKRQEYAPFNLIKILSKMVNLYIPPWMVIQCTNIYSIQYPCGIWWRNRFSVWSIAKAIFLIFKCHLWWPASKNVFATSQQLCIRVNHFFKSSFSDDSCTKPSCFGVVWSVWG